MGGNKYKLAVLLYSDASCFLYATVDVTPLDPLKVDMIMLFSTCLCL